MESQTKKLIISYFMILVGVSISFSQGDTEMATIKSGSYIPLYGATEKKEVNVNTFKLDMYPVTNQEFVQFLKTNPEYTRSKIKRLFAKESYLSHWKSDFDFGNHGLLLKNTVNAKAKGYPP